jgi:hypothetical protein
VSAEPASAGNCIPPATLVRVDAAVFLPIIQPPLTGTRPPEEAPANEAVQHTLVHYSEGGGSLSDYHMAYFSIITTPLVSPSGSFFDHQVAQFSVDKHMLAVISLCSIRPLFFGRSLNCLLHQVNNSVAFFASRIDFPSCVGSSMRIPS